MANRPRDPVGRLHLYAMRFVTPKVGNPHIKSQVIDYG